MFVPVSVLIVAAIVLVVLARHIHALHAIIRQSERINSQPPLYERSPQLAAILENAEARGRES